MKKIITLLTIAIVFASTSVFADHPQLAPVAAEGGGSPATSLPPMPPSFEWLKDAGALKTYVLNELIESGEVRLSGNFIQLDENKNVRLYGEDTDQILAGLSAMQFQLSMPRASAINVFCELYDATGYGRAQVSGHTIPTLLPNGNHVFDGKFQLEMQEIQPIFIPGVTRAVLSNEFGDVYANGQEMPVWNGGYVGISMSMLTDPGYLILMRDEPNPSGGTRKVTYGYRIGTGLSVEMLNNIPGQLEFKVKNYWTATDAGQPMFNPNNGQSIPLNLDMPVTAMRNPPNWWYSNRQSQPAAKVTITAAGRVLSIRIGCFDENGILMERGTDLKMVNHATGVSYSLNVDTNGIANISLPPGKYGVWYKLTTIANQRG